MKNFAISCLFFLSIWGCIRGGTHGYIKAYKYSTSKQKLENAIMQILVNNPAIVQDSIKGYYNDDTSYLTIKIFENGKSSSFIFRYYGDKDYWDTAKISEIFIAYAYDTKGNGGSSGNGAIKLNDNKLKSELTGPFERVLIKKLDSMLVIKHVEE